MENIPKYRIKNWSEYNNALKLRGSLTIWVTAHPPSFPGLTRESKNADNNKSARFPVPDQVDDRLFAGNDGEQLP